MSVIDNLIIATVVYGVITAFVLAATLGNYHGYKSLDAPAGVRKEAARDVLLSPLWPLLAVAGVVWLARRAWAGVYTLFQDARREV